MGSGAGGSSGDTERAGDRGSIEGAARRVDFTCWLGEGTFAPRQK